MSGWKHANERRVEHQFGGPDPEQWVTTECSAADGDTGCGCTDPRPDPLGLCAVDGADHDLHPAYGDEYHERVPYTCFCGHPLDKYLRFRDPEPFDSKDELQAKPILLRQRQPWPYNR